MSVPPTNALDLCRALIRCPSVTPADGGSLPLLEALLKAHGFATHRVKFSEDGTPEIDNLYARIGTGAPTLVFAGHTDVVPVGDPAAWRFDPFAAELSENMVWGRGANDMKGAIAAFTTAALAFIEKHGTSKGSIGFLITGDEEGPAINGTAKLLAWTKQKGEKFDHCLLGEPTNPEALGDMIKIGRRGSLNATLIVEGRQGHVAYPRRADNPIPHLLRLAQALIAPPLDTGTAHFDPSNLEIVTIDVGNPASNVIPAKAQARFNVRFNDLWTPERLADEIERRCAAVAEGARYRLVFEPCNALAFVTEPDRFTALVAAAIERHTGHAPKLSTTGGTSDARFIRAYCPVVEFGLVGATMHMVDERVAVADIETLTAIYTDILENYFGVA
ncbi:succinyl-diaminopimelate desuccinylase [Methylovirgula sp. HY1]|uniref:succinyl-diaminopimelate desuccinylase n=1 Tax=Methylovirgula sp. HY1 TaxID=2822761 RepID=UPI001C5B8E5C|nr:succinyl-diaminopimelate desuccinylase [Methylovirgula sp. HY1]QXX75241.1 Succinyl-diaminopimelate desuccinylase [Methylovirgula sp. HY1]